MASDSPITPARMHAGRPYGLILFPYVALSLALHLGVGAGVFWKELVRSSDHVVSSMKKYGVPAQGPNAPTMPAVAPGPRVRRYRLNYFTHVQIPLDLPAPVLAKLPEPPKPPKLTAKPHPKGPAAPSTPSTARAPQAPTAPGPAFPAGMPKPGTDVKLGDKIKGKDGEYLMVPKFELTTLVDQQVRTNDCFLKYPTIFIVGDLSTKTGLDDMFNWLHFFHDLMHNKGVVSPPWVLGIGEGIENPYFLTPDLAADALSTRFTKMGLFSGPLWGDIAYDQDHQFIDGLGIEKLPVPQVYMSDLEGYVHIVITGRLEDLDNEQIVGIATEIKDKWGMTDLEFMATKLIVFNWQHSLQNGTLKDPTPTNPEAEPLGAPPTKEQFETGNIPPNPFDKQQQLFQQQNGGAAAPSSPSPPPPS